MIISSIISIQAQDIHFSQFYATPLLTSPANTGNYEGDYRINYNQKRQWSVISPYNTFGISYDQDFKNNKDNFSFGGAFVNDLTNQGRYNTTKLYASGAWHTIHKWHYFHVGLQAGLVIHSLSEDIKFAAQYVDIIGDFDENVDAGEQIEFHPSYLDMNLGLGWHKKFDKIEPHVSFALFHFNRPNNSATAGDDRLAMRQLFHFYSNLYFFNKVYFAPGLLHMGSSGISEMFYGSNFSYILDNQLMEKSVYCGVYFNNGSESFDAIVATAGLRYNEWKLGLSYDIDMSGLKTVSNSRGGLEISLSYTALSTKINKLIIPCERF